jgi:hypothetical protein
MQLNIRSMVSHKVLEYYCLKITRPFKHLKQLNITFRQPLKNTAEHSKFNLLGILTLLQAFPLLHKLSLMVSEHS